MSSNELDPGGSTGGGSDGDSLLSNLITIDADGRGFDVKWLQIVSAGVSGTIVAFYQTVIGAFQSMGLAAETVSMSIRDRMVRFFEAIFGVTEVLDQAWATAAADVATLGIFGFAVSVAIVAAVVVIYNLGVSLLVE